jgi:hypothetical protein
MSTDTAKSHPMQECPFGCGAFRVGVGYWAHLKNSHALRGDIKAPPSEGMWWMHVEATRVARVRRQEASDG